MWFPLGIGSRQRGQRNGSEGRIRSARSFPSLEGFPISIHFLLDPSFFPFFLSGPSPCSQDIVDSIPDLLDPPRDTAFLDHFFPRLLILLFSSGFSALHLIFRVSHHFRLKINSRMILIFLEKPILQRSESSEDQRTLKEKERAPLNFKAFTRFLVSFFQGSRGFSKEFPLSSFCRWFVSITQCIFCRCLSKSRDFPSVSLSG